MGAYKGVDRNKMAVELYFAVLRKKKAEGYSHKEAKSMAYDAVELRHEISYRRLNNIIYDNHDTLKCDRNLFLTENKALIETLEEANASMMEIVNRNNKLLNILKEGCDV